MGLSGHSRCSTARSAWSSTQVAGPGPRRVTRPPARASRGRPRAVTRATRRPRRVRTGQAPARWRRQRLPPGGAVPGRVQDQTVSLVGLRGDRCGRSSCRSLLALPRHWPQVLPVTSQWMVRVADSAPSSRVKSGNAHQGGGSYRDQTARATVPTVANAPTGCPPARWGSRCRRARRSAARPR